MLGEKIWARSALLTSEVTNARVSAPWVSGFTDFYKQDDHEKGAENGEREGGCIERSSGMND